MDLALDQQKMAKDDFETIMKHIFINVNNYERRSIQTIINLYDSINGLKTNKLRMSKYIVNDLDELLRLLSFSNGKKSSVKEIIEEIKKLQNNLSKYIETSEEGLLERIKTNIDVINELNKRLILDGKNKLVEEAQNDQLVLENNELSYLNERQNKLHQKIDYEIRKDLKKLKSGIKPLNFRKIDNAYRALYEALELENKDEIINKRGRVIRLLEANKQTINDQYELLKGLEEIKSIIDSEEQEEIKKQKIYEVLKRKENEAFSLYFADIVDNYEELKREFFNLYDFLEVKKTKLYNSALKEELKKQGELLASVYNSELIENRQDAKVLTRTLPKTIGLSIQKLSNTISEIKNSKSKRSKNAKKQEAIKDLGRIVITPGANLAKFAVNNWYTFSLLKDGFNSALAENRERLFTGKFEDKPKIDLLPEYTSPEFNPIQKSNVTLYEVPEFVPKERINFELVEAPKIEPKGLLQPEILPEYTAPVFESKELSTPKIEPEYKIPVFDPSEKIDFELAKVPSFETKANLNPEINPEYQTQEIETKPKINIDVEEQEDPKFEPKNKINIEIAEVPKFEPKKFQQPEILPKYTVPTFEPKEHINPNIEEYQVPSFEPKGLPQLELEPEYDTPKFEPKPKLTLELNEMPDIKPKELPQLELEPEYVTPKFEPKPKIEVELNEIPEIKAKGLQQPEILPEYISSTFEPKVQINPSIEEHLMPSFEPKGLPQSELEPEYVAPKFEPKPKIEVKLNELPEIKPKGLQQPEILPEYISPTFEPKEHINPSIEEYQTPIFEPKGLPQLELEPEYVTPEFEPKPKFKVELDEAPEIKPKRLPQPELEPEYVTPEFEPKPKLTLELNEIPEIKPKRLPQPELEPEYVTPEFEPKPKLTLELNEIPEIKPKRLTQPELEPEFVAPEFEPKPKFKVELYEAPEIKPKGLLQPEILPEYVAPEFEPIQKIEVKLKDEPIIEPKDVPNDEPEIPNDSIPDEYKDLEGTELVNVVSSLGKICDDDAVIVVWYMEKGAHPWEFWKIKTVSITAREARKIWNMDSFSKNDETLTQEEKGISR